MTRIDQINALQKIDPAKVSDPTSGYSLGPNIDAVSDAAGLATFSGLPDGVYLVNEIPSRAGDVAWTVVSPFLVSLPQHNARELKVYAKNQPIALNMTVNPTTVSAGDKVSLVSTGTVPAPDAAGRLHRYVMVIRPDPAIENPVIDQIAITTDQGILYLNGCGTAPKQSTIQMAAQRRVITTRALMDDCRCYRDQGTGAWVIELMPTGLAKLAAIRAKNLSARVVVTITGTVSANVVEGQRLRHKAALFVDGWPVPEDLTQVDSAAAGVSVAVNVLAAPSPPGSVTTGPSTAPPTVLPTAPPLPAPHTPGETPVPAHELLPAVLGDTGAIITKSLFLLGAGILACGVIALIIGRRHHDEEGSTIYAQTSETTSTEHGQEEA